MSARMRRSSTGPLSATACSRAATSGGRCGASSRTRSSTPWAWATSPSRMARQVAADGRSGAKVARSGREASARCIVPVTLPIASTRSSKRLCIRVPGSATRAPSPTSARRRSHAVVQPGMCSWTVAMTADVSAPGGTCSTQPRSAGVPFHGASRWKNAPISTVGCTPARQRRRILTTNVRVPIATSSDVFEASVPSRVTWQVSDSVAAGAAVLWPTNAWPSADVVEPPSAVATTQRARAGRAAASSPASSTGTT